MAFYTYLRRIPIEYQLLDVRAHAAAHIDKKFLWASQRQNCGVCRMMVDTGLCENTFTDACVRRNMYN